MQSTTLQAIILRFIPYLEYDGILELLCQERGKISVMAKGIQRSTSKNKGTLRCFSHIECEIFLPKSENSMGRLIRMHPIQPFLQEDIFSQTIFSLMSECTSSLLHDTHPHPKIFFLWTQCIQRKKISLLTLFWFLCHMYSDLGIFPSFTHCSQSHKKFSNQNFFYWNAESGIQNTSSQETNSNKCKLTFPLLKFFNFVSTKGIEDVEKIFLTPAQKEEIWNILWWFYAQHSKFPPRSKKIFESIWEE